MSALTPGAVGARRARTGAAASVLVCGVLSVATVVGSLVTPSADAGAPARVVAVALVAAVPLVCGAVIARRAPGTLTGPLVACAGLALVVTNAPGERLPPVLSGIWMLLYVPFALVLLTVPDERPRTGWARRTAWAVTIVASAFVALCAMQAVLPSWRSVTEPASIAALAVFAALVAVCAASPVVRYRTAGERERRSLRWLLLAGMSLPSALLLCWASYVLTGGPDLVVVGLALGYVAIPVGVAVAVVRPDALDVDRAVVATITATILAAAILCALSAAAAVTGLVLSDWSAVAAVTVTAGLTLVSAATFPAVHRVLDAILYPERARTLAALRALTARVDSGRAVPEDVQDVLRAALRDPGLVVAVRRPADGALVDVEGRAVAPSATTVPVRVRGDVVGALMCSGDRARRPAADVAHGAAVLVDAVRSRAALAGAKAAVEASRRRLLRAGYEQRRRLERDLHDGALQELVALGMQLRVLQRTAHPDAAIMAGLDSAVARLAHAVAELRAVAHGMRPSALDDGLAAAVSELAARTGAGIDLDVHVGDLPDLIALTAYYVVSEAVTNALRHAAAARIGVSVHVRADALHVVVDDDGRGGAALLPTGGLTGLADRVAASGGVLRVVSPQGRGTRVEAVLPCAL